MSINLKKNRAAIIAFVVLAIVTIAFISMSQLPTKAVWSGPPGIPPNLNVAAPINIGSATQTIAGGLNIATTSGNIGIGTTAPSHKLTVAGDLRFTSGDPAILYYNNGYIRFGSVNPIPAGGSFSEKMRIDSGGNVGIGTVAPGQKLEVNGGVRINTVTARPVCGATTRGTTWFTQGAAGVQDSFSVCAKDAGNLYAWRNLY